jgi:hypothetical protein
MEERKSRYHWPPYFLQGMNMTDILKQYYNIIKERAATVSMNSIGWFATVLMHCAFVPNIISVLLGVSDRLPSIDVVIFVWGGLFLMFLRATITRDVLNIITGGIGFFLQAVLLALVVFK